MYGTLLFLCYRLQPYLIIWYIILNDVAKFINLIAPLFDFYFGLLFFSKLISLLFFFFFIFYFSFLTIIIELERMDYYSKPKYFILFWFSHLLSLIFSLFFLFFFFPFFVFDKIFISFLKWKVKYEIQNKTRKNQLPL